MIKDISHKRFVLSEIFRTRNRIVKALDDRDEEEYREQVTELDRLCNQLCGA